MLFGPLRLLALKYLILLLFNILTVSVHNQKHAVCTKLDIFDFIPIIVLGTKAWI